MNGSYIALGRSRPPRQRGIRIRLKRRVTQLFCGITGRASRAFSRCCSKLRSRLHRLGLRSGYVRVREEEEVEERIRRVPKGHLTVYVGPTEEGGATVAKRVVVPLIYIHHPLFRRLLEEAQEKYGFDQPGAIIIPCPESEFETIKSKIAAGRARNGPFRPWLSSTPRP